jgi:outer membrane translocation and assembly module TamA
LNAAGWNDKKLKGKPATTEYFHAEELQVLNWLENNGYPFAEVSLNNVEIKDNEIKGSLEVKKGPLYRIDSIRVFGKAKIKNLFLQHYIDISNGNIYSSQKLQTVSNSLNKLKYLQT